MFWRKNTGGDRAVKTCAHSLFEALVKEMKVDGRVRAEDLIAAAASIAGE